MACRCRTARTSVKVGLTPPLGMGASSLSKLRLMVALDSPSVLRAVILYLPASSPALLQCLLCTAGVGCCVAMAMPQVHVVPYALDNGHAAARGAEMLSLMLGFGIVSRLVSGWLSDRIGGVRTLALGAAMQALALAAFIPAESLSALYAASVAFGLSQGGIVPSYAMIIRRYFPAGQAGWRIGLTFVFTIGGMALGGWLSGAIFDLSGSYAWAFLNAIAFNLVTIAVALWLWRRSRREAIA